MRSIRMGALVGLLALGTVWPAAATWEASEAQMSPAEYEANVVAAGRPRLFFQAAGLEKLRESIKTTHKEQWLRLKAAADEVLDKAPPEYRGIRGDPTRPGTPNDEMLWQRNFGYRIPGLAMVALLDPDPKYLDAVRAWAMKPGEYPLWGAGLFEGTDLAAGHQLYGISIAYDWLYDRWTPEEREKLEQILVEHGKVMYEAATGINDRGWWKDTWRQNHAWLCYGALGVTAVALAGDAPGAGEWLAKAEWGYRNIVAELPDEGAYEEGIPYWGYGMESLMRFITATRPYLATDFYQADYLKNTHLFRLYMSAPEVKQVPNFSDGPDRDWHVACTTMYRLASEYRNPLTQWFAEALPNRGDLDGSLYSLLWYDPSVKAKEPSDLPKWHAFKQTGFAGARTSWDEKALTLHLRSGKAHVSHSHLDVNNFLLNVGGEWLVKDYGYGRVGPGYFSKEVAYFSNSTLGHNCLVIGGRDQRKEEDSQGVISDAVEQDGIVWFRSDATACYDGAESAVRELALAMPNENTGKFGYVLVRDRARTKAEETFDFMLQPGGEVEMEGDSFTIQLERARLYGKVLAPKGVSMELLPGIGENINVRDPMALKISAPGKAKEMEFVVALIPLADGEQGPVVTMEASTVRVGADAVELSAHGNVAPKRSAAR